MTVGVIQSGWVIPLSTDQPNAINRITLHVIGVR